MQRLQPCQQQHNKHTHADGHVAAVLTATRVGPGKRLLHAPENTRVIPSVFRGGQAKHSYRTGDKHTPLHRTYNTARTTQARPPQQGYVRLWPAGRCPPARPGQARPGQARPGHPRQGALMERPLPASVLTPGGKARPGGEAVPGALLRSQRRPAASCHPAPELLQACKGCRRGCQGRWQARRRGQAARQPHASQSARASRPGSCRRARGVRSSRICTQIEP
jgi:hypothetical protein